MFAGIQSFGFFDANAGRSSGTKNHHKPAGARGYDRCWSRCNGCICNRSNRSQPADAWGAHFSERDFVRAGRADIPHDSADPRGRPQSSPQKTFWDRSV